MKKKLYVTGNINAVAKYLNMDEFKVLSIFDYDARKSIKEIEKDRKDKNKNEEATNKSQTIRPSSKGV